ncbi:YihY/virulence factor BrkB family protein [Aeromicrobium sp. CF3.5]|uniref:YihY/virulence factor BrkB family protein n=1 Tax=Aeromicrobium sp. CF3.5 TaxID=3373078 RepID=UPI003EE7FC8C
MKSIIGTLKAAWAHLSERNGPLLAAGVAFYAFLAIFPAMIAAVLSYGLIASPETVSRQSRQITNALPSDAASLITGQMDTLTQTSSGSLGVGLLLSVTLAIYSASGGIGNLLTALTAMFEGTSDRNFVKAKLQAVRLTAGAVLFAIVAISLVAAAPALFNFLDLPGFVRAGLEVVRWLILLGAIVLAITALFRNADHVTDDKPGDDRHMRVGVLVAAGMWLVASLGFSLYVDNFGSYGETYGALAGVVALLLWLWISMLALLLGASVEFVTEAKDPDSAVPADV